MNELLICPTCKSPLSPEWFFCPNCGRSVKEKPPNISIFKQLVIYFVSFFLAPLGLAWGFKYVRYKDTKVKVVGLISIFLTVASIALLFIIFKNFMDQYTTILNNLSPYKLSN